MPHEDKYLLIEYEKYILDLIVAENIRLHTNYALLKLTSSSPLPEMRPGQFAEIRVDGSPTTFLRRPISINYVDTSRNEVWFLVQLVGDGTKRLGEAKQVIRSMLYFPWEMALQCLKKLLTSCYW